MQWPGRDTQPTLFDTTAQFHASDPEGNPLYAKTREPVIRGGASGRQNRAAARQGLLAMFRSTNDQFQALIDRYLARMTVLREAFERDGYLLAISSRDPQYSILLTRNGSSEAPWRVTSFRQGVPVGHREYDRLEGGGPVQNAFHEFSGSDLVLTPRPRRRSPSPTPPQPV
jgi:hypothetical protein